MRIEKGKKPSEGCLHFHPFALSLSLTGHLPFSVAVQGRKDLNNNSKKYGKLS